MILSAEYDIVARLRAVLHNDRSVELMNREAADEIERLQSDVLDRDIEIEQLRKQVQEAEPLLNELWERRTEATEMRAEIARLREELTASHESHGNEVGALTERLSLAIHERDEARRMWCELMAANTAAHREQVANRHGWDCFKEER